MTQYYTISSPGRICLFGEHQDYLGLPVIPMAINKRLELLAKSTTEPINNLTIKSKQLKITQSFNWKTINLIEESPFRYIQAVFSYFEKHSFNRNITEITIDSEIPIGSGLSSSAALLVACVFLVGNNILKLNLSPEEIAEIAYICERKILGISCGRMDQYASAIGGIFHMTLDDKIKITKLNLPKDALFIIGDSKIRRLADTPLKAVQRLIFDGINSLNNTKIENLTLAELQRMKLKKEYKEVIEGVIQVRENTKLAFTALKKSNIDLEDIGDLLTKQHELLSTKYRVSHPRIDKMCEKTLDMGALGAKMTGAGFGGSMFALTDNAKKAIRIKELLDNYGEATIVKITTGVKKL